MFSDIADEVEFSAIKFERAQIAFSLRSRNSFFFRERGNRSICKK